MRAPQAVGKSRRHTQQGSAFTPSLIVLYIVVAACSAAVVIDRHAFIDFIRHWGLSTFALACGGGLAAYLHSLSLDEPIHPRTALIRTMSGGIFGWLLAKAGAGGGLNEAYQQAIAGFGGAQGPRVAEVAMDRLLPGKDVQK